MLWGNFHSEYEMSHHLRKVRFRLSVIKSRMCYYLKALVDFQLCCSKNELGEGLTPLAVQWLGLHASTTGGAGSIPGRGPRSRMPRSAAKNKKMNE